MNACLLLILLPVALLQHTRAAADNESTLEALARRVDNTYTSQLTVEAEALSHAPNDRARPVRNGHFVAPLRLRPLSRPQLLAVSSSTLGRRSRCSCKDTHGEMHGESAWAMPA